MYRADYLSLHYQCMHRHTMIIESWSWFDMVHTFLDHMFTWNAVCNYMKISRKKRMRKFWKHFSTYTITLLTCSTKTDLKFPTLGSWIFLFIRWKTLIHNGMNLLDTVCQLQLFENGRQSNTADNVHTPKSHSPKLWLQPVSYNVHYLMYGWWLYCLLLQIKSIPLESTFSSF